MRRFGALPLMLPLVSQVARAEPPNEVPRPRGRGSVVLFDNRSSIDGLELSLGLPYSRPSRGGTRFESGLFDAAVSQAITVRRGPFFLTGILGTNLRGFDSKSFAWSVTHHALAAGAILGPLEPEVRAGFSLVTLDVFHGNYSAEVLTPRVSAGLGLRLGNLRLGARGSSEFLFRFFGPSYLVHSFGIDVRFDVGKPKVPPAFRKESTP